MTTTQCSKISVLSMLFGMGVSVILCILTSGVAEAEVVVDVEAMTNVEEKSSLIGDDVAETSVSREDETAPACADTIIDSSFFGSEPLHASDQ